jgi:hypothetical protein
MTGLPIGHCHLKGHLFKLELVNSPECNRCKQASKTASHILCDCEALGTFKIQALGPSFDATRWLCRHIYRQDTVLCSRCRAARCIRAAQMIKCGWSAWVTNVPTLHVLYFILFYSILFYSMSYLHTLLSVAWQCQLQIVFVCMFCIFAVQTKNFTFLCVLYPMIITHPMVKLTNFYPWHVYEYTWCSRSNMPQFRRMCLRLISINLT